MEENDFVSIWLAESGNPAIEKLGALNLDVADRTFEILKEKNLSADALAVAIDVNPDEINGWLSGRHVFSEKVIGQILTTIAGYSAE